MIKPDLQEFMSLSKRGNLIPVYKEILADMDTPVTACLKMGGSPSFLFESVVGGEKWARYSFAGSRPSRQIRVWGRKVEIKNRLNETETFETDDPVGALKRELSRFQPLEVEGLPRFYGGLVGYIGYDTVRFFERVPDLGKKGLGLPDMFFMLTDTVLIFDSLRQKIKVVSNAHINGDPENAYIEAVEKIEKLILKLKQPLRKRRVKDKTESKDIPFISSFGEKERFKEAVLKAKEYVMAGDVVQVVLSQRFDTETMARPFDIYRALRVINPSPYMYYLDSGDAKLIGSSPEILVRLEGDRITLRPIAGTRRRGKTEAEDRTLEEELKNDPKEIAEHIMLVDLGRNDVGRVAKTGSVNVTELMTVERYSHVMHLVSNVEGVLKDGFDAFDVLKACFPAGTVTGAPKVRAMEIIEELEPVKRGPYAGAVGYFGYSGNMDTCITIRTIIMKGRKVYVQAGAGIVADSNPEREYKETVNKAMGMMKALELANREEF